MRLVDLFEKRNQRESMIVYHGTSDVFLDSIKKHGLVPNPSKRIYDEKSGVLETFGGVYLTPNYKKAESMARKTAKEAGGNPIVFRVMVSRGSGLVDEDDIVETLEQIYSKMIYFMDDSVFFNEEEMEETKKKAVEDTMDSLMRKVDHIKGAMQEESRKIVEELWDNIFDIMIEKEEQGTRAWKIDDVFSYDKQRWEWMKTLIDRLTRYFNHANRSRNIRVNFPIGWSGRNKIVGYDEIEEERR